MDRIGEGVAFSRSKLLSRSPECEVWRATARWPTRSTAGTTSDCVLKFFSTQGANFYLKEVNAYDHLVKRNAHFRYPKPFGADEWTRAKYAKFCGKAYKTHLETDPEATIRVIMFEYIFHSTTLSKCGPLTRELAKKALDSLSALHTINIAHGNVSLANALVVDGPRSKDVVWIDFACSWPDASSDQCHIEYGQAATYFAALSGISKSELVPESRTRSEKEPAPAEEVEGLPRLVGGTKFYGWRYVNEGTHAEVYRARQQVSHDEYCLKVYYPGDMVPFEQEKAAYEALARAEIGGQVPKVYGYWYGRLADLDFPQSEDDPQEYYVLVMEYLEGAEPLSSENVTIASAAMLIRGLVLIHRAGILYNDLYRRNMMIIPAADRGVWLDFTCAHRYTHTQVQEFTNAMWIILEALVESYRRRGARQMIAAYMLYASTTRRALSYLFSVALALEGLAYIIGISILSNQEPTSFLQSTPWIIGPLNLFCAALVFTDSTAIHLQDAMFQFMWGSKLIYLLFTMARTGLLLASEAVGGLPGTWLALRTLITFLWILSCWEDFIWEKDIEYTALPGLRYEETTYSEPSS